MLCGLHIHPRVTLLVFSSAISYTLFLVFAASTLDKAYVYDLQVEKYTKLAEIKPVKQPKLTNIAFNAQDPVLLIGDNHGGVTLTKLSPNLNRSNQFSSSSSLKFTLCEL